MKRPRKVANRNTIDSILNSEVGSSTGLTFKSSPIAQTKMPGAFGTHQKTVIRRPRSNEQKTGDHVSLYKYRTHYRTRSSRKRRKIRNTIAFASVRYKTATNRERSATQGSPFNVGDHVGHYNCIRRKRVYKASVAYVGSRLRAKKPSRKYNRVNRTRRQYC